MRVLYMGTPDFAVAPLQKLYDAGHEITLVVTQPDRRGGRGKGEIISPVKAWALAHDVPVFQPERIREEASVAALFNHFVEGGDNRPEIGVVAAFGQILPKEVLDFPVHGCLNVHASLLPLYRGASPIQEALLRGDTETGVTIMRMDEGLDTGDILLQKRVVVANDETGGSLFDKLAVTGAEAIAEALTLIEEGKASFTPQDEEKASVTRKIEKSSGKLEFTEDAVTIERKIRAFTPWPSATCRLGDVTLKITKAEITDETGEAGEFTPGTVLSAENSGLLIRCGRGKLLITRLQAPGKKEMSSADYLRGLRREVTGMVLT